MHNEFDRKFKPGDRVRFDVEGGRDPELRAWRGTVTYAAGGVAYVSWDGARVRKEFTEHIVRA